MTMNPLTEAAHYRSQADLCRLQSTFLCVSRGWRAALLLAAREFEFRADIAQAWAWGEHWFGLELGEEFAEPLQGKQS